MKRISLNNATELANRVIDEFHKLNETMTYPAVGVIAFADVATERISIWVKEGFDIADIHIEKCEFSDYDDEYVLTLTDEGIWCEPAKRETGYYTYEDNITFILDNVSSRIIPNCTSKIQYEVSLVDQNDEECDGSCDNCQNNLNSLYEFKCLPKINATYCVNDEEVDEETYRKAKEELDQKLKHFDTVDELIDYAIDAFSHLSR